MKIENKIVIFPRSLKVKFSGKIVKETETHISLEGEGDDSYLKIFNPFRGVAKLLLYENETWVDSETNSVPPNFDLSSLGLGDLDSLGKEGSGESKK